MKRVCLYHGVDLDGFCGGAIYAKAMEELNEEFELIPANYGWDLPWEKFEGADVTMIDFSMQPWENLVRLHGMAKSVVWIDHHKSAITEFVERVLELPAPAPLAVIDEKRAGCELAWAHYFPKKNMPLAVRLLGRYDVWDHADEQTLPFQYGMRLYDMDPRKGEDRGKWSNLLNEYLSAGYAHPRIIEGLTVLRYQSREDEIGAKASCFEIEWEGLHWIAANRGGRGSQFFDSVYNEEVHDGMMSFGWNGEAWTFGLYTTKSDVDCSEIAKRYGGGGHKGAAGFRTTQLPFELHHGKKLGKLLV